MDYGVVVTVVERRRNHAAELASLFFLQGAMGDDVVEHLATRDVLEQHVVVRCHGVHFVELANVFVVQQVRYGGFTHGADVFGLVGFLFGGVFGTRGIAPMLDGRSRDNLDGAVGVGHAVVGEFDLAHAACTHRLDEVPIAN